jgi:hypothetical protein
MQAFNMFESAEQLSRWLSSANRKLTEGKQSDRSRHAKKSVKSRPDDQKIFPVGCKL